MSRLTIDVTEQQHQSLKLLAALEGKTIKQYALERLFPQKNSDQDLDGLKTLIKERIAEAEQGQLEAGSIAELAQKYLKEE